METIYLEVSCFEGPGLKIRAKNLVYVGQSAYQKITVYDTEHYGRCLFLDDLIQSSENDHEEYEEAILRKLKPTDKNLLVLGGGDGHTAQMALRLNPGIHVTVVELDGAVIKTCEEHFGQQIFSHPNVTTVIDDAIHFMERTRSANYDCIVCDLTDKPIGHNKTICKDFYLKVFSLAKRVLNLSGWISAYVGCNMQIAEKIFSSHPNYIEKDTVYISSFGEPCFFVHGQVPRQTFTRGGKS